MKNLFMKKKSHSSPLALITLATVVGPILYKAAVHCYHAMTDKESDSWIPSSKDSSTSSTDASASTEDKSSDKFKY